MLINLIESIIKKLVDKPDLVTINEVESDGKQVIQIRVAPQDLSRVIGSEGRTFRALRMLVQVLSPEQKDLVVDSREQ
jgi:predicted RNA-binding protein YlqC (UPF0109 family)